MSKLIATLDPTEARITRALTEVLPNYAITEQDGCLIMESPAGNAYIVDPIAGTCSCPSWQYDGLSTCKHTIAARHLALEQGRDLEQEAAERRRAEWKAQIAAERASVDERLAADFDAEFSRIFA